MNQAPTTFSAEAYFATQTRPPGLKSDVDKVSEFIKRQKDAGRKVVLVTMSVGTRGATSAEYFLKAGYAVIFMHRQFSLQPFSRHYSHTTNPFLDLLTVNHNTTDTTSGGAVVPTIAIIPEAREKLLGVLDAYRECHNEGTLLTLTFVTVNDYLWLLRAVSEQMASLGRDAMYYLAAAVSDFFLPTEKMSEHKIQSGKGSLQIQMDQVPKILKPMVSEWTPEGFIVSFKLETDDTLLIPKARAALERYGHQVVIGNELHRRKFEVVFVSRRSRDGRTNKPSGGASGGAEESPFVDEWLRIPPEDADAGKEIEVNIVERLVAMHGVWVEKATVALHAGAPPTPT
ncbi:hypothetical protein FRB99_005148 [Tulasnella sp. 403]|nr:hypothetical protein FRB99_005148 [Tulasnella sp. 403]